MLDVADIDLKYGAAQALKGVSLTAVPGRVACVMGRNGVGKTSLMRAVVGQEPISGGAIHWEGEDISAMSASDRARRGIAIVPQGREIFPLLTVEENLQTGFAGLPRDQRFVPPEVYDLFPVLKEMLRRRGKLQQENENFAWNLALSEPLPEDNWTGMVGFIHSVLYENYLKDHPAPEDCEYYMCGPPMMNQAVIKMLEDLGVEPENILLDDFGG